MTTQASVPVIASRAPHATGLLKNLLQCIHVLKALMGQRFKAHETLERLDARTLNDIGMGERSVASRAALSSHLSP